MKNFEDFEAFKLNKVQMNAIAGGTIYCYNGSDASKEAYFENLTMEEAQKGADAAIGKDAVCEELIK